MNPTSHGTLNFAPVEHFEDCQTDGRPLNTSQLHPCALKNKRCPDISNLI